MKEESPVVDEEKPETDKRTTVVMLGSLAALVAGVAAWKSDVFASTALSAHEDPGEPRLQQTAPPPQSNYSSRRPLEMFVRDAALLHERIDVVSYYVDAWETEYLPLATNDDGRRLASDSLNVDKLRHAFSQDRIQADGVNKLRKAVDQLVADIDANLAEGPPFAQIESDRRSDLDAMATQVEALVDEFWVDIERIPYLVHKAKDNPKSELTLGEAVALANSEYADRVSEQRATRQREREEAAMAASAESERLIALAQAPETIRLYSAFLAEGNFNSRTRTKDPGPPFPVSVQNLNYHGVLSDDYLFASFACGRMCEYTGQGVHPGSGGLMFSYNDRPVAHDYPKTKEEWSIWKERRENFNELVPTLLDLELLRP